VRSRRGCDHEILDEFMGLFFSSDRKSLNTSPWNTGKASMVSNANAP